jgi:hypothetical protein
MLLLIHVGDLCILPCSLPPFYLLIVLQDTVVTMAVGPSLDKQTDEIAEEERQREKRARKKAKKEALRKKREEDMRLQAEADAKERRRIKRDYPAKPEKPIITEDTLPIINAVRQRDTHVSVYVCACVCACAYCSMSCTIPVDLTLQ